MSGSADKASEEEQFEYIPPSLMPPDYDYEQPEMFWTKVSRKFMENPFVPLCLLATVGALTRGLNTLRTGDTKKGQMMMRYRVGFQGLTVLALFGGHLYTEHNLKIKKEEEAAARAAYKKSLLLKKEKESAV